MRYEKVYIAGKITGDPNYYAKFHAAEDLLQLEYGWNYWYIVNPVEEVPQKWPWWRQMGEVSAAGGRLQGSGHAARLERQPRGADRARLGRDTGKGNHLFILTNTI